MATDKVMQDLQAGMMDLQKAFSLAAARRQEYVIAAIVAREDGKTFPATYVSAFDSARGSILRAAADLDLVLQTMKSEDNAAYLKVIGAFNEQMAKVPSARTSSESIEVILSDALPAFPRELLSPSDSPAVRSVIDIEKANYNMRGGLGFVAALVAPISASCATAAAATVVTGVGPVVIGVGCALLVAAVAVGSLYLAYKAVSQIPRLVMAFSPQAAASLAEAERLEAAAKLLKESKGNLSPEAFEKLARELPKPPEPDKVPWAALAVVAVAGLWFLSRRRASA